MVFERRIRPAMGDKPALKFGRAGLCTDQFVTCAELRSCGVAESPRSGAEWRSGVEWSRVEPSGGVEWRSGAEWSRVEPSVLAKLINTDQITIPLELII